MTALTFRALNVVDSGFLGILCLGLIQNHFLFQFRLICIAVPSANRFKVDVKRGYFLLANVLSKQPPERLNEHATLELAHHVLKAGMFKGQSKETGRSLC